MEQLDVVSDGIAKLVSKLEGWGESAIQMLPNFLVALVAVAVFVYLSRWAHRGLTNTLGRSNINKSLQHLIANSGKLAVLIVGLILALSVMELQKTVFSLLAGVGILGLALGFAFQDLAANFMSGVMLAVRSPIKIGDVVEIDSVLGTVKDVRLRDTLIKNFDGHDVFVPNKDFTSSKFQNYSSNGERRVQVQVGVDYNSDVDQAVKLVQQALNKVSTRIQDKEAEAYLEGFGGSSVDIVGQFWFPYPQEDFLKTRHEALSYVKKALDDAEISIPFPVRTLDIPAPLREGLESVLKFRKDEDSFQKDAENENVYQ